VDTANSFARDLITQETGWRFLRDAGIALIAADSPDAFPDDAPTAVMIRQILGSVAQFEKAMLVSKLREARERRKAATGKCEGWKSLSTWTPRANLSPTYAAITGYSRRLRSPARRRDVALSLKLGGNFPQTTACAC
jgi:DNA invertase Pin-like site-specific DNA recombinase